MSNETNLKSIIESLLFVAEKPVSLKELSSVSGVMIVEIQKAIGELEVEYKEKGINIIRKGEYFSFISAPANSKFVGKLLNEELRHDLSPAALETLAIITYKQPVTKSEIEEVRGVNSDQMVRNLMIRGLITEVGRKEALGRPILYGTTMEFIEYFGILSENELPKIDELRLFASESKDENS